jgi:FtsH-binding integral membrane protein
MKMTCRRVALRLLACADAFGAGEDLVGDLLEEVARGRSHAWVCRQVIGLYGVLFTRHVRTCRWLTPQAITLGCCVTLLVGVSIGSIANVLEAWLVFYAVTGTLSLFADMASRTVGATVLPTAAEGPRAGTP